MKKIFLSACLALFSTVGFAGGHEMNIVDELQPRWVGLGEASAEFNNYTDDVSVTDQSNVIEFTPSYILDEQENGISATYRVSILATEFKRNIRDIIIIQRIWVIDRYNSTFHWVKRNSETVKR